MLMNLKKKWDVIMAAVMGAKVVAATLVTAHVKELVTLVAIKATALILVLAAVEVHAKAHALGVAQWDVEDIINECIDAVALVNMPLHRYFSHCSYFKILLNLIKV